MTMRTPFGSRRLLSMIAACTSTALVALTSQPSIAETDRKSKPALTEAREKPVPTSARMARLDKERKQREWRTKMSKSPLGRTGCFRATYPDPKWAEVECSKPGDIPFVPAGNDIPYNVGGGNNYSAEVSNLSNAFIAAEGSFASVQTGGIIGPWKDENGQEQSPTDNAYSLQLNSNKFATDIGACNNQSDCYGWQQFIYSSKTRGGIFMQSWLRNYAGACPSGWRTYGNDCFKSSGVNNIMGTIASDFLKDTILSAKVEPSAQGPVITVILTNSSASQLYSVSAPDEIGLGTEKHWTNAEFAIVGDCCSYTAKFIDKIENSTTTPTTITTKLTVHNGTTDAPSCALLGFTGERNNLYLAATPAIGIQPSPTMVSNQASTNAPPASCVVAAGLGDIHIRTFPPAQQVTTSAASLAYDFQAEGEFILARTDMGFEVQTRQRSGAPTWPNATLNQAIAAKIGNSVLVFSVADNDPKVFVDGTLVSLKDGERRVLPDDGDLIRHMDMYLARDMHGNSIQVYVQRAATHYLDVYVGLGRWPTYVKGLLASASDNAGAVEARKGKIFTAPFDFDSFYKDYGDSWRVTNDESLFSQAKAHLPAVRASNPKERFDASHLKPKIYLQAKKRCLSAGVKKQFLDDCILDVAVLGDKRAALTHIHPQLRAVGERPRLFLAKDQFRAHHKPRKTLPGHPEVNQTLPGH